mgnify:FL=1
MSFSFRMYMSLIGTKQSNGTQIHSGLEPAMTPTCSNHAVAIIAVAMMIGYLIQGLIENRTLYFDGI